MMNPLVRLTAAVLACLAFVPAACAEAREIQVAMLRFSATEKGEASALAELNEEIARELCRRLALRCVLTALPFAEIIPGVASGRYQLGVGNVLRTSEREAQVLFSQTLWRSSSRLVGTATAVRKYGRDAVPASLHGARIAVTRGSQQHRYLQAIADKAKLTLVETSDSEESLALMRAGRADFSLMPMRNAYFLLTEAPSGQFELVGPGLIDDGLGGTVHMILSPNETRLRSDVDATLDTMRRDGSLQRIVRRYMPILAD